MADYTKGGGIAAAVVEGLVYFFILPRDDLTKLEVTLLLYLSGLTAYFAYLAYKKNKEPNPSLRLIYWSGGEIGAGFLAGIVAFLPVIFIQVVVSGGSL